MTPEDRRHAEKVASMARAVLDAVAATQAALEAVNTALSLGQQLGVPTFGFAQLMACRQPLAALVHPDGPAAALARNELASLRVVLPIDEPPHQEVAGC